MYRNALLGSTAVLLAISEPGGALDGEVLPPQAAEPAEPAEPAKKKPKGKGGGRGPKKRTHFGDEERDACSIETFCRRHSIGIATYYVLRKNKQAPRETYIGGRTVITAEDQKRWRERVASGKLVIPVPPKREAASGDINNTIAT
jgi:hypothetical protein